MITMSLRTQDETGQMVGHPFFVRASGRSARKGTMQGVAGLHRWKIACDDSGMILTILHRKTCREALIA